MIIRGDGNFLKARQEAKKGELDEQLKEYINEWRKQRAKEEEELKRLKEKQVCNRNNILFITINNYHKYIII